MSFQIMLSANICECAVLVCVIVDNPIDIHDHVSEEIEVILFKVYVWMALTSW